MLSKYMEADFRYWVGRVSHKKWLNFLGRSIKYQNRLRKIWNQSFQNWSAMSQKINQKSPNINHYFLFVCRLPIASKWRVYLVEEKDGFCIEEDRVEILVTAGRVLRARRHLFCIIFNFLGHNFLFCIIFYFLVMSQFCFRFVTFSTFFPVMSQFLFRNIFFTLNGRKKHEIRISSCSVYSSSASTIRKTRLKKEKSTIWKTENEKVQPYGKQGWEKQKTDFICF